MPINVLAQPASAFIKGRQQRQQSDLLEAQGQRAQQGFDTQQTERKQLFDINQEKLDALNKAGGLKAAKAKAKEDAGILNAVLQLPESQQQAGFETVSPRLAPEIAQLFNDETGQPVFNPQRATLLRNMAIEFDKVPSPTFGQPFEVVDKSGNKHLVVADKSGQIKLATGGEGLAKPAKQPGVQVNVGGEPNFKVPTGFMLKDPQNPKKGVTPIPGGPQDKLSGESAGKAQMLRTAKKQIGLIKKLTFDKDGSPDWVNIANSAAKTPKTEGRKLAAAMEVGIQAITRLETGAAMPPSEVDNTRARFQPSVKDSAEVVKLKLDMFEDFISGALRLLAPDGRFDEQRFNEEFESRLGQTQPTSDQIQEGATATNPQTGQRVIFTNGQWQPAP